MICEQKNSVEPASCGTPGDPGGTSANGSHAYASPSASNAALTTPRNCS